MNVTVPVPPPVPMNITSSDTSSGAGSAGLAVGLTLLFLLLVIVPGVIAYKRHGKRRKAQFVQDRSQKKEDNSEAAHDASHPYTSMYREQAAAAAAAQGPIYENFTRTAGRSRPATDQSRSSREPDEDLYLQCDFEDDAIYSNDPMCNPGVFPDPQEEDLYITPHS